MKRILIIAALLSLPAGAADHPAVKPVPIYSGTGEALAWTDVFAAMDAADIVVIGEAHTDARGHDLQRQLLAIAVQRWDKLVLSLEEFDRSQQSELNAYERGELTGSELKEVRDFVDPRIKNNWTDWYLPKVEVARDGGATLLASNAPLQYSRMVRNLGCDQLPDMSAEERELFACPSAPVDPEYFGRFDKRMRSVARSSKPSGLKTIGAEQTERMFRAQRVWDATMAESVVTARADSGAKVIHLVGSFHSDFGGGLIQEIAARDPDARMVVICLVPRRGETLQAVDLGRADFVIYTRG